MDDQANHRLFIGVPIDEHCQLQIDHALAPLRTRDDIHWTPKHRRHLTLAFLGETPAIRLASLRQQFTSSFSNQTVFKFTFQQLIRFPDARGRIIAAVNKPSPELLQLYKLTRDLLDSCSIPFEEREYRPHITLGRIRNAKQQDIDLQRLISLQLVIDRVNLYESVVANSGRLYRVLQQTVFQPSG